GLRLVHPAGRVLAPSPESVAGGVRVVLEAGTTIDVGGDTGGTGVIASHQLHVRGDVARAHRNVQVVRWNDVDVGASGDPREAVRVALVAVQREAVCGHVALLELGILRAAVFAFPDTVQDITDLYGNT